MSIYIYYKFINLEIMCIICFHSNQCALVSPECLRSVVLQSLVSELSMSLGLTCIKWEFSNFLLMWAHHGHNSQKWIHHGLVKTKKTHCRCLTAKLSDVYPEEIDCRQRLAGIRTRWCKEHKDLDRPLERNTLRPMWWFVLP